MMKRKIVFALLTVVSAGLLVMGLLFLPEQVVTQVNLRGESSTTMPRLAAALLPFVMTGIGNGILLLGKTKENRIRGLSLSGIGILVSILSLVLNR